MNASSSTNSVRSWWIGLFCAVFSMLLFGTTFSLNKFVMNQHVSPILLGFNRSCIAILCLLPFFWPKRDSIQWSKRDWWRAFCIGAFAIAGAMILEYSGTHYTTASNASLIIATESVLGVFFAVLILKEKLRRATVFGGFFALAGMILVLWDDIKGWELHFGSQLFGDMLVTGSVLCWCVYTISSKQLLERSDPLVAHFFVTIFGTMTLALAVFSSGIWREIAEMTPSAWLGTLYLGSFCSGLAYWLFYQALKRLPASLVAITLTMIPLFGVAFSFCILDERLNLQQTIGGTAIALGVGYAVWPQPEGNQASHKEKA